MYLPLQNSVKNTAKGVVGTMPIKGTNKRDLPQLLKPDSAQYIENYLVFGQGEMKKRGGLTLNFDTSETDEMTVWEEYQNDYEIVAYGTKVRAYDTSTGTFTDIKTDFTADNGGFGGDRYGDYFFVTNKVDGLYRISREITYSDYQDLAGTNTIYIIKNAGTTITPTATITDTTTGNTATVASAEDLTTTTMKLTINSMTGVFTQGGGVTGGTLAGASITNINPFTAGAKITGATSGATAIILEDDDNGATGTLTLGEIVGDFQNGELLEDDEGEHGQGTSSSLVTFAIDLVGDATPARYCKVISDRLLTWNLKGNAAGWEYSDRDNGDNPPFTNFTTGSGFDDPGSGYYRNGITALTAEQIGDIIFIGFEKGWHAFTITQTEIGGVISKYDQAVQTSSTSGIQRAKMTEVGLIACGDFGIKRLVSLGQSDIPYSEQWETLTEQLGEDFFDDADFTDADIDYDADKGYIYVTYRKDSATNNYVLAIKANQTGVESSVYDGATSFITGWNILKFLRKSDGLYGTSAVTGGTYKLFDGESDLGSAIYCQYLQELNFGGLTEAFDLNEFYCAGKLTSASTLTVSFDRYDRTQRFFERERSYTWNKTNTYPSGASGWGSSAYGSSGYGGSTTGGLIEDYTGGNIKLRSNMRILVRFESNDYSDHTLSWFSAVSTVTTPIRRRTLSLNT